MTDRDLEIELSTLRAELAQIDAVMARRPALDQPTRAENIEKAISMAGRAEDESLRRCIAQAELRAVKLDRDDWRDIAIGLRDLGGPPLPTHAKQYEEYVKRYTDKIRKGG